MNRRRRLVPLLAAALLLGSCLLPWRASAAPQATPPQSGWKVFQEFGLLLGSWSGAADSSGRIGGRSVTLDFDVDGATLVYRANTFYPAAGPDKPELKTQEVAFIVYDGDKRKYSAVVVFSTKVWGLYDVEVRADGTVQLVSRELFNVDGSARSRIVLTKKAESELAESLEVAPQGKDFVPFLTAKLQKK